MRTSSVSPGAAPAMAIGPVIIWPGCRTGAASLMARNAGGTTKPDSGGGYALASPETHSRMTVSPEPTVRTGGIVASNTRSSHFPERRKLGAEPSESHQRQRRHRDRFGRRCPRPKPNRAPSWRNNHQSNTTAKDRCAAAAGSEAPHNYEQTPCRRQSNLRGLNAFVLCSRRLRGQRNQFQIGILDVGRIQECHEVLLTNLGSVTSASGRRRQWPGQKVCVRGDGTLDCRYGFWRTRGPMLEWFPGDGMRFA
jgi:hypothetical protein